MTDARRGRPARRDVLIAASGLALGLAEAVSGRCAAAPAHGKVKAIGFDMFTIFDPRSVDAAAETLFPGKGAPFANAWRARIFDYCWLRTLNKNYADFEQVLKDALEVSLRAQKLEATPEARAGLIESFSKLKPYPELDCGPDCHA